MRAVQHLSQMDRVEPPRRVRPPQHRLDVGRQDAALQGGKYPIAARPGRDERAYGHELTIGFCGPSSRGAASAGSSTADADHSAASRSTSSACASSTVSARAVRSGKPHR